MFYATTIKTVGDGGAVDVQGRHLSFIGYLPVKEGDTVYTDGRYIFGNAPPKGAPAVFDTPGGIPVLGDYDASGENELRGYVNKSGKYKRFKIAGDEWTTNAKKTYAHDGSIDGVDDANVIDAEIALDENGAEDGVYTVEKVVTQFDELDEDYCYIWEIKDARHGTNTSRGTGYTAIENNMPLENKGNTNYPLIITHYSLDISAETADFVKLDTVLKECDLVIRKNAVEVQRIKLSDIAKRVEDFAFENVKLTIPDHEPEDHIKSRAILHNFKILQNGKWEAVIEFNVWAERGFLFSNTFYEFKIESQYDRQETDIPDDFPWGGTPEEITEAFQKIGADETVIEQVQYNSSLAQAFYNAYYSIVRPRTLITYHTKYYMKDTPIQRYYQSYYHATVAVGRFLLKATSEGEFEFINKQSKFIPLVTYKEDDTYSVGTRNDSDYVISTENSIVASSTRSEHHSYLGDREGWILQNLLSDIAKDETDNVQEVFWEETFTYYDSRRWENAPDYENGVEEIADDFSFPVQDDFTARINSFKDENQEKIYWKLGGVYDKDRKRVVDGTDEKFSGEETAHQWNMSLATLKSGDYLFGIRDDQDRDIDGKLFRINGSDGKVAETFAERGFKNFRLREMKKISKAKK